MFGNQTEATPEGQFAKQNAIGFCEILYEGRSVSIHPF